MPTIPAAVHDTPAWKQGHSTVMTIPAQICHSLHILPTTQLRTLQLTPTSFVVCTDHHQAEVYAKKAGKHAYRYRRSRLKTSKWDGRLPRGSGS